MQLVEKLRVMNAFGCCASALGESAETFEFERSEAERKQRRVATERHNLIWRVYACQNLNRTSKVNASTGVSFGCQ